MGQQQNTIVTQSRRGYARATAAAKTRACLIAHSGSGLRCRPAVGTRTAGDGGRLRDLAGHAVPLDRRDPNPGEVGADRHLGAGRRYLDLSVACQADSGCSPYPGIASFRPCRYHKFLSGSCEVVTRSTVRESS